MRLRQDLLAGYGVACILLSSTALAGCPDLKDLDISLMILNYQTPLVSDQLAEQVAWAFFQVLYSESGIFEAKKPATIVDLDDRWSVTFQNALFAPPLDLTKRIQPKEMGVEICKSNGAILLLK